MFSDYWQFSHMLRKFFKALGPECDGFINLELNSILPCYDQGYLDEAQHHIKITLLRHHTAFQTKLTVQEMENLVILGDILS